MYDRRVDISEGSRVSTYVATTAILTQFYIYCANKLIYIDYSRVLEIIDFPLARSLAGRPVHNFCFFRDMTFVSFLRATPSRLQANSMHSLRLMRYVMVYILI